MFVLVFILTFPAAAPYTAQTQGRFDSGPYKGFTKAAVEHIVIELGEPFNVRSVEGNTLFLVGGEPCAKVLFEIRDSAGNVRGVVSDARGRFKFSEIAPGIYDFSHEGWFSVYGGKNHRLENMRAEQATFN